jgi:flagellar basal body L-ring protein FlgH
MECFTVGKYTRTLAFCAAAVGQKERNWNEMVGKIRSISLSLSFSLRLSFRVTSIVRSGILAEGKKQMVVKWGKREIMVASEKDREQER